MFDNGHILISSSEPLNLKYEVYRKTIIQHLEKSV